MQSDYSGQGVNWILTGRSDMCSPVKRSLSKWWTEIRLAAWSSCNLLHVIWWGVGFDGLPITCDIRERERERNKISIRFKRAEISWFFHATQYTSLIVVVKTGVFKNLNLKSIKNLIRTHRHAQALLHLLWLKIKSTCSAGWGSFIFERSSFSSLSLPSSTVLRLITVFWKALKASAQKLPSVVHICTYTSLYWWKWTHDIYMEINLRGGSIVSPIPLWRF